MTNPFGNKIRELRTQKLLLLRQVAAALEMDTALLSKIERGERPFKREQIPTLAKILDADKVELMTLWLANQLYTVVEKEEKYAMQAMRIAEEQIRWVKKEKPRKGNKDLP